MSGVLASRMIRLMVFAVIWAAASGRTDVRRGKWQPADANLGPDADVIDSMMQTAQPDPQGSEHRSIPSNFVLSRVDDPEMESDGRMAAWITPDGRMMIPPKSRRPISHANDVLEDLPRSELAEDSLVNVAVRESSPLSRQSKSYGSLGLCVDNRFATMAPSATYSNGSNIFLHDIYSVSSNTAPLSEERCPSLYAGCYFTDVPQCQMKLFCSNATLSNMTLPDELISFEMHETEVSVLESRAFAGINIRSIRLVANKIKWVGAGAFEDTRGLMYLSLESNLLQFIQFEVAFRGLDSLIVLWLKDNQLNFTNVGLKEPEQEPTLRSLVYLNLANNPLSAINQYAFAGLRNSSLAELNLQSCNLRFIHPDAFRWLPKLIHVDLFDNPELLSLALKPTAIPFYIPPLRQLGLGLNQLAAVPTTLLNQVNASLAMLNLSGNFFLRLMERFLQPFPLLTTLILENCGIFSIDPRAFDTLPNLLYLYLGKNELTRIGWGVLPPSLGLLSIRQNPTRWQGSGATFSMGSGDLSNLTRLFWLDMNDMNLDSLNRSAFEGLSGLNVLQLRNSGIMQIGPSTFQSLGALQMLDLGDNPVSTLPQRFSEGLHNVVHLFLDHCSIHFPEEPPRDASESPFSHMTNLISMILASNEIDNFYGQLIASNSKLQLLDLSYNKLSTWQPYATRYMGNETSVCLSNNVISYLPDDIGDQLASLLAVDLSDNALICTCPVKELLLLASKENGSAVLCNWQDLDAYKCTDMSGSSPLVRRIQNMTEEDFNCERQPQPTTDINDPDLPQGDSPVNYIAGAACALLVISAASGYCYMKRRQLAHAWFTYRHRVKPSELADDLSAAYEYDAFISFNASDRQWVYDHLIAQLEGPKRKFSGDEALGPQSADSHQPNFRLCVHDRDFTPGRMITENIVSSICSSRHVIIVLSKAYCESKWCRYELNLAHHQLMDENRNNLVLILLEDVPKSCQYSSLRYVMRTKTYLVWSSDIEGQKHFWRRLTAVLTGQESSRPS